MIQYSLPSVESKKQLEYWKRLYEMKEKYSHFLENLMDFVMEIEDKEVLRRVQILSSLLYCTPETQRFCCRMEILEAAECQISYWRKSYGHQHSFL